MKGSGIVWVGNIPMTWSIRALFQVVDQVKNKNTLLNEKNLLSLSYGRIIRKNIDTAEGLLPASFDGYNIIECGDIVLRLTDLQNDHTSLRVGQALERGIITSAYISIRPKSFMSSRYIFYLLYTFDIKKGFYGMGSGVRQGLNYGEVKMLKIPVPPIEEQEHIVHYLDAECLKIEELIAEAKASIEDYKQWKKSIVSEAISNGINSDISIKDSGNKRIGTIPAHWTVRKMKTYIKKVSSGLSAVTSDTSAEESGKYVLRTSAVSSGVFKSEEVKSVLTNAVDRLICPVERDTLVMSRMNTASMVGYCAYVAGDYPDYFLPDKLWKIHTKSTLMAKYAWFLINAPVSHDWFASVATGTSLSMLNISLSDFYNLVVAVPPVEEQKEICDYLEDRCNKIDACIREKQALVHDLESYKKSLIYEVVTGKRKVV